MPGCKVSLMDLSGAYRNQCEIGHIIHESYIHIYIDMEREIENLITSYCYFSIEP